MTTPLTREGLEALYKSGNIDNGDYAAIVALLFRAERAEADCAALRVALRTAQEWMRAPTHHDQEWATASDAVKAALASSNPGAALLEERREMREALEAFLGARWDIGMHGSGSGVTHRFDGDGAATGCSWCQTKANARALLAKTERTTR